MNAEDQSEKQLQEIQLMHHYMRSRMAAGASPIDLLKAQILTIVTGFGASIGVLQAVDDLQRIEPLVSTLEGIAAAVREDVDARRKVTH